VDINPPSGNPVMLIVTSAPAVGSPNSGGGVTGTGCPVSVGTDAETDGVVPPPGVAEAIVAICAAPAAAIIAARGGPIIGPSDSALVIPSEVLMIAFAIAAA